MNGLATVIQVEEQQQDGINGIAKDEYGNAVSDGKKQYQYHDASAHNLKIHQGLAFANHHENVLVDSVQGKQNATDAQQDEIESRPTPSTAAHQHLKQIRGYTCHKCHDATDEKHGHTDDFLIGIA